MQVLKDKSKNTVSNLATNLIPGDVFLPGEILKDELDSREMSQKELSILMGVSPTIVSDLIHGRRKITAELAIKLESALDISAKFWVSLQGDYDINVARIAKKRSSEELNATSTFEKKQVKTKLSKVIKRK